MVINQICGGVMMGGYLYGASVQGIQEFIFKTNRLQEIVGASEIVKDIANEFKDNYNPNEIYINVAGNIKAVFEDEDECKKVVLEFPKRIMQKAYGITISQAVVAFEGEAKDYINTLEKNLKIQRNRPSIPLDMGINIMKLNPKTARPTIAKDEDRATIQKRDAYAKWFADEKMEDSEFEKSKELSYISNDKNKIAVIHIDGNGLGKLIPKLGDRLSTFSIELNKATIKSVNDAKKGIKDFRKIIVGGDDVTVICSANDALTFTKSFLENFEENTKDIQELKDIKIDKLTACAGIAYCNEKYPFHYAVDLAEALCGVAKDHSQREHSCLMFHNIQGSHFQSWSKFVKDELTITNDKCSIRCDFGPYYSKKEDKANIGDFINTLKAYRCEGSPISRLREWLRELDKRSLYAQNLLDRINTITEQKNNWNCEIMNNNLKKFDKELSNEKLIVPKDGLQKTPIYDILQIISATDNPKATI